MTILSSTSSPKIAKSDIFGSKFKDFYFANYALRQFKGADFKYDNGFLKFQPENTQIKDFFCPKCKFFYSFLHETDFENENSFLQIPVKNIKIRNFLRKLKSFFLLK